jgi:hypothetical protein
MKIRNGFVSNSSSSSFHIYGIQIDESDFSKMILEKKLTTIEKLEEQGINEVIWDIVPGLGGEYIDNWGSVYFGRYYSGIGDDETGKEFKESTQKALKEFLGDLESAAAPLP